MTTDTVTAADHVQFADLTEPEFTAERAARFADLTDGQFAFLATARFANLTDGDLNNARAKLENARTQLTRSMEANPSRAALAADLNAAQCKAAASLRTAAVTGMDAARSALPGTQGWSHVETMVTAFVLSSPEFTKTMLDTLGDDLATDEQIAEQHAQLARFTHRQEAIGAELAARAEDVQSEYMKTALAGRGVRSWS
jgi:uncharacterized membrane protein